MIRNHFPWLVTCISVDSSNKLLAYVFEPNMRMAYAWNYDKTLLIVSSILLWISPSIYSCDTTQGNNSKGFLALPPYRKLYESCVRYMHITQFEANECELISA
jgi:hypothetical protein